MSDFISLFGPLEGVIIAVTIYHFWRNRHNRETRKHVLIGGATLLIISLSFSFKRHEEYQATLRSVAEEYKLNKQEMKDAQRDTNDAIDDDARDQDQ
jgi:hypothetical protein